MSVLAPLLRPASWRLAPGAADVPWLRHMGLAVMLASVLALVAWSVAVWLDAWRLRDVGWAAVLALPLCGLGLFHAWRLSRAWLCQGAALTLRWTGPVETLRTGEAVGGWRVDEWGAAPVDVSLIWDWQRVMLLRLQRLEAPTQQTWVWLQDRPSQVEREIHRLRTLLCLPASMTRPSVKVSARARLMASSPHEASAAAPARMNGSRHTTRTKRPERFAAPSRSRRAPVASLEPLRLEDDFPATQVLERWSADGGETGVHGGGRQ